MAKPSVEQAPYFDKLNFDIQEIQPFLAECDVTDDKGRYLHWDQLRWRVPKGNAESIWRAVKFKRMLQSRVIGLPDEEGALFYLTKHNSMEAKLHQIAKLAGGNVGAIGDARASDNLQQKYLVSSLIMEEAITSAQLEGASTTREVAKRMLEEEREPGDEDERMILNNFWLLKLSEKKADTELTVDLILEFHQVATKFTTENNVVPGEFRQSNDIYVEDDRGEIAHQPPSFEKIPERLRRLCDFANYDHSGSGGSRFLDPVVKAIILHFMLGYEHPFRDGNGRTARALFYWFMLKNHYELFRYVSISKLLKDDPKGYGLSFLYTEKDQNDLTYFIDFQLDIILAALEDLKKYLEVKTDEFYQVLKILDNSRYGEMLNFVQKDIVKRGTKEPGRIFTAKAISKSYEIAENTARSHLQKLVDLKLLLLAQDGRTKQYIAPSDLVRRLES